MTSLVRCSCNGDETVIVDVPIPAQFHTAGVNQLYLAWKIAIGTQQALTRIGAAADDREAADEYWHSVQPELANAYSLIQQAMEMALKGGSLRCRRSCSCPAIRARA